MNDPGSPAPAPPPRAWPERLLASSRALLQAGSDAFRVPFRSARPENDDRHCHRRCRRPALIHRLPLHALLVVPVLLAVATAAVLFAYSDVNVAMIYSQCSARARLPALTQGWLPAVLGTPVCFLVSFVQEAVGGGLRAALAAAAAASMRAVAVVGAVLAFVAGLLTVSTVEAARLCNGPSVLIAYPAGAWLAFDLVGGAVVWELVILPAFFRRSKALWEGQDDGEADDGSGAVVRRSEEGVPPRHGRHLAVVAEVVAIPAAIAVGYVAPSLALLVTGAPAAIAVWFFFPVYVGAVRRAVRAAVVRAAVTQEEPEGGSRWHRLRHRLRHRLTAPLHLESHRPSLVAVYALPVACSAVAHAFLVWHLAMRADDRRELTRSTLRVMEIDMFFVGLTVLYWLLVEAGAGVVARTVAWSVVLGPGAGLCLGWIHRERELGLMGGAEDVDGAAGEAGGPDRGADEETPLLR